MIGCKTFAVWHSPLSSIFTSAEPYLPWVVLTCLGKGESKKKPSLFAFPWWRVQLFFLCLLVIYNCLRIVHSFCCLYVGLCVGICVCSASPPSLMVTVSLFIVVNAFHMALVSTWPGLASWATLATVIRVWACSLKQAKASAQQNCSYWEEGFGDTGDLRTMWAWILTVGESIWGERNSRG